jgi:hypothetical protein
MNSLFATFFKRCKSPLTMFGQTVEHFLSSFYNYFDIFVEILLFAKNEIWYFSKWLSVFWCSIIIKLKMYFLSRSYDKQVLTFITDNCAIKENPIQRKMSVASENVELIFEISRSNNFWLNKTLRNCSGHKSTDLEWSNAIQLEIYFREDNFSFWNSRYVAHVTNLYDFA